MKIDQNNYRQFSVFILFLLILSFLIVYIFSVIISAYKINVPIFISLPSFLTVYGLLFYIFNNYIWKSSIFRKIQIIKSENLNGVWKGYIISSYDDMKSEIEAELKIEQTATKIKIHGKFNNSKSISLNENFAFSEVDQSIALFYFYKNEPNYDAIKSMAIHEGSVKLIFDKEKDVLIGSYYSGRNRNNYGTIFVKRIK